MLTLLNTELTEAAVGTGTTPIVSATQLTTELYRKPITVGTLDGNTLVKELFLDETEANATLTEIGLFGSGQLFASGGAHITKDSTQSLTISFEIEVKEVS